nr:hypothetical transcript [Hymenolepis microstoma]
MYPETDLGVYARGVAPFSYPYDVTPYFQSYDVAPSFCSYGVVPFYLHRTPTLGFMATLQPAIRDISSRKHTAGRYSSISMGCRIQAHVLQTPTVSYGNTLDGLKWAYLEPSSKPVPFVGTQPSRSIA